ncbi:MAG: hypothetical protein H6825_05365 [Planctomycetes bacterium]|nr:hypothetical protein [Planctomycetota bacterium]
MTVAPTNARRARRRGAAACVLLAALAVSTAGLPGCVTLERGGLFASDRDDVWVEYFDNRTFYRDVQFRLSEDVVAEILSRPGLHLSTSRDSADVVLSGRIVDVQQNVLSEDPTRTITSASSTVSVVVEILDARTGDVLKSRRLSQRAEFVPALSEEVDAARRDVFVLLARDIVRELETEF